LYFRAKAIGFVAAALLDLPYQSAAEEARHVVESYR